MPQGSVLGPCLFTIYINDIDDGVTSDIVKFADDTKVFGVSATDEDVARLQDDLTKMFQWSLDWQMLFNVGKCKVIHMGFNNEDHAYFMNGVQLEVVTEEKNLGVTIHKSLKVATNVANAVKKANRVLGILSRTLLFMEKSILLPLYMTLVRPHLEYAVQAWAPIKDITLMEKVQRRFTRMIPEIWGVSYADRLEQLGLMTLEMRRLRSDIIETFKILKGLDDVPAEDFFQFSHTEHTRGHSLKLFASECTKVLLHTKSDIGMEYAL